MDPFATLDRIFIISLPFLSPSGEKLSKQELQSNSIIKKLRMKERQNDQVMGAQRLVVN